MKTLLPLLSLFALAACGGEGPPAVAPAPAASDLPESFHAAAADARAVDVFDLRAEGKDGQEIVVKGTVQDIAERYAALVLFDESLEDCSERPADTCATPWDYCCVEESVKAAGQVPVEFFDGGAPGKWHVEGFHGLGRLSEVVVAGTLHVDEHANMRITAASIHVRE
jgi:predicted small lipoprotein YifL